LNNIPHVILTVEFLGPNPLRRIVQVLQGIKNHARIDNNASHQTSMINPRHQ